MNEDSGLGECSEELKHALKNFIKKSNEGLEAYKKYGVLGREATTVERYIEIYRDTDISCYSFSDGGTLMQYGYVIITPRHGELSEWEKDEQNLLSAIKILLSSNTNT